MRASKLFVGVARARARTTRTPVVGRSDRVCALLVAAFRTRRRRVERAVLRSPTDDERRSTPSSQAFMGKRRSTKRFASCGRTRPSMKKTEKKVFASVEMPMNTGVDLPMEPGVSVSEYRAWLERRCANREDDWVRLEKSLAALFGTYKIKARVHDALRVSIRDVAFGLYADTDEAADADADEATADEAETKGSSDDDDDDVVDDRYRVALVNGAGSLRSALADIIGEMRRAGLLTRGDEGAAEAFKRDVVAVRSDERDVIGKSVLITDERHVRDWFAARGRGEAATEGAGDEQSDFYKARRRALLDFDGWFGQACKVRYCRDVRTLLRHGAYGFLTQYGQHSLTTKFTNELDKNLPTRGARRAAAASDVKAEAIKKLDLLVRQGDEARQKLQRFVIAWQIYTDMRSFVDGIAVNFLTRLVEVERLRSEGDTSDAASKSLDSILENGFEAKHIADLMIYITRDIAFQHSSSAKVHCRELVERVRRRLQHHPTLVRELEKSRGEFIERALDVLRLRFTDTIWSDLVNRESKSPDCAGGVPRVPAIMIPRTLRNYAAPAINIAIKYALASRIRQRFTAFVRAELARLQHIDAWTLADGARNVRAREAATRSAQLMAAFLRSRKRRAAFISRIKFLFVRNTLKSANREKVPVDRGPSKFLGAALNQFSVDIDAVFFRVCCKLHEVARAADTMWLYPINAATGKCTKPGLLPIASFGASAKNGYVEELPVRTLMSAFEFMDGRIADARLALGGTVEARANPFVPAIRDADCINTFILEEVIGVMSQEANEMDLWNGLAAVLKKDGVIKSNSAGGTTRRVRRLLKGSWTRIIVTAILEELTRAAQDTTLPSARFFTNDAEAYLSETVAFLVAAAEQPLSAKTSAALTGATRALQSDAFGRAFGDCIVRGLAHLSRVLSRLDVLQSVASEARDASLGDLAADASISRGRRRRAIRAMRIAIVANLDAVRSADVTPAASETVTPTATATMATATTTAAPPPPTTATPVDGGASTTVYVPPPSAKPSAMFINIGLTRRPTTVDRTVAGDMYARYAVGRDPMEPSNAGRETALGEYALRSALSKRLARMLNSAGSLKKRIATVHFGGARFSATYEKWVPVDRGDGDEAPLAVENDFETIVVGIDPGLNRIVSAAAAIPVFNTATKEVTGYCTTESSVSARRVHAASKPAARARVNLARRRAVERRAIAEGADASSAIAVANLGKATQKMRLTGNGSRRRVYDTLPEKFLGELESMWIQVNGLGKTSSPAFVIAVGQEGTRVNRSWSGTPMKGAPRTSQSRFVAKLESQTRYPVRMIFTSEYKTSKLCPKCGETVEPALTGRVKIALKSKRSLVRPPRRNGMRCVNLECQDCGRVKNRDTGVAAVNMLERLQTKLTLAQDITGAKFIERIRRDAFKIEKEPGAYDCDDEEEEDVDDEFDEDERAAACALEELTWTAETAAVEDARERDTRGARTTAASRAGSKAKPLQARGGVAKKRARASRMKTTSPSSSPDAIDPKRLRARQTCPVSPGDNAQARTVRRSDRVAARQQSGDGGTVAANLLQRLSSAATSDEP